MSTLNKSSTLREIQKYILDGGIKLGFDKLNATQRCLMLGEEVGELFKSVRKYEKIKIDSSSKVDSIEDELSDILKQVCAVANYFKIDLEKAFWQKEAKDTGRWK